MDQSADPFTHAVAATLRAERAAANVTLDALAERSGVPKTTMRRYLQGDRDIPMPTFYAIARGLGVSATHLLDLAEERFKRDA